MRASALAAALALVLCSVAFAASVVKRPTTHTVTIEGMKFRPQALTVASGDSIVWINKDLVPHTATSATGGVFDSKLIAPDKSWRLTIRTKGTFAYLCTYHPAMKGSLRVE
jgi:plastocyanin